MWKQGIVLGLFLQVFVHGQEQYLREVVNPNGPPQVFLSGGGFNGNSEDAAAPLPLQAEAQPIPENGAEGNPFTSGDDGFGLRLTQPQVNSQVAVQSPPQQPTPQRQSVPVQQTQPVQQSHVFQPPVIQQAPLILPPLAAGQQYVDAYGRPIIFAQPATTPPPPTTAAPVVRKQALVDQYGRQLAEYQISDPSLAHQVIPAAYPVAHQVIQPAAFPVAHQIIQPTQVAVPAIHKVIQAVDAVAPVVAKKVVPPALTLQTYAVPAIHKVGNLEIPYAQKLVYAQPPPATPVVKAVQQPVLPAVAQPISPAPAQVLVQDQHQVLVQQPQIAFHHPPEHVTHVVEQPHVFAHPVAPVQHAPVQIIDPHAPAVVPHVLPPPIYAAPAPPVLFKKFKQIVPAVAKIAVVEKTIIPDVTLIQQPVFPKALFQRHIFNVKHGSQPLIYQDLCTVYPFQKNLRACVLKKAVLPELHHPDIRTVHVEEADHHQPHTEQSVIAGGSPIVVPAPTMSAGVTVTVSKNTPNNIQETIRRESAKSRAQAAAKVSPPTTAQPEVAESRDSVSTGKPRRKKSKERKMEEKEFKLA